MMNRRSFFQRLLGIGIGTGIPSGLTSPPGLSFDLSPEEAQALANVVEHVGGDSQKSQRRFIRTISDRLYYEGYHGQLWNTTSGSIHFTDDDKIVDWRDGKRLIFPRGPDLKFRARWRKSFMEK